MKNRRTIIVAALLAITLCLGIGYAALNQELVIGSKATMAGNNTNFNVTFTEVSKDAGDAFIKTATVNGTTANYELEGMSAANDTATMTFTIKNETTDVVATLASVVSTSGDLLISSDDGSTQTSANVADWFEKTISIKKGADDYGSTGVKDGQNLVLNPGEEATVTVTVKLKNTVTNATTLTGASVVLHFNGTSTVPASGTGI